MKPTMAILISVSVLLLSGGGWLFYKNSELSKQNSALQSELSGARDKNALIQEEIDALRHDTKSLAEQVESELSAKEKLRRAHLAELKNLQKTNKEAKSEMTYFTMPSLRNYKKKSPIAKLPSRSSMDASV